MKWLKYNLCAKVNRGTEEEPVWEDLLTPITMGWNEANVEIAKAEAYNGEYEIFDDDQPDPDTEPTFEDRIEARLTYMEMMTGFLEV